jgi:hypothetical protein
MIDHLWTRARPDQAGPGSALLPHWTAIEGEFDGRGFLTVHDIAGLVRTAIRSFLDHCIVLRFTAAIPRAGAEGG